jgi:hypothetical protein
MATEAVTTPKSSTTPIRSGPARRRGAPGPDRVTVALFSLASFLVVLALLATQLAGATSHRAARSVLLVRKIYRTTVVETVSGATVRGGTSVSQSVSSSGANVGTVATPTTRTSG